jgi:hypothetical protein
MSSERRLTRSLNLIRALRRCGWVDGGASGAHRWALQDAIRRMSRLYGGSR